jgi:hypothetical protein
MDQYHGIPVGREENLGFDMIEITIIRNSWQIISSVRNSLIHFQRLLHLLKICASCSSQQLLDPLVSNIVFVNFLMITLSHDLSPSSFFDFSSCFFFSCKKLLGKFRFPLLSNRSSTSPRNLHHNGQHELPKTIEMHEKEGDQLGDKRAC